MKQSELVSTTIRVEPALRTKMKAHPNQSLLVRVLLEAALDGGWEVTNQGTVLDRDGRVLYRRGKQMGMKL